MNKEKLIDLVLRIHFVNNFPAVGGAFLMGWAHGMEYQPGVTYHEQLADLQESLGLPRKLPRPEYPERIWAAMKTENESDGKAPDISKDIEVFSGSSTEVHAWCQEHKNEYSYMTVTDRTMISEAEAYNNWKAEILTKYGLSE